MVEVIKVPQIGEPERTEPIPDYKLDEITGGTLIPNQAYVKALARQVKVLRKQLGISVEPKGETAHEEK